MSSATLPPWLSPWAPGLVYGHRVHQPANERGRHRPRLTIYTYGHGDTAPVIRFSSWSESVDNPGGAGGALRWEPVPPQREAWHDVARDLDRPSPYDTSIQRSGGGVELAEGEEGGGEALAWGGVLRGWACGVALLALLLMLLRLGEYFGEWKALMRRRRLHRQRANVRANSRVESQPTAAVELPTACTVELPPPYSTCGAPSAPAPGPKDEEPPPTYADCVEFFNKNGITTFMYNRETDLGVSSRGREPKRERPEGQRHLDRILRACGINIAAPGNQTTLQTTNSLETNDNNSTRVDVLANRDVVEANLNGDTVVLLSADDDNYKNIGPSNNMVSPNNTNTDPKDIAYPDHGIDPNDGPKGASAYMV